MKKILEVSRENIAARLFRVDSDAYVLEIEIVHGQVTTKIKWPFKAKNDKDAKICAAKICERIGMVMRTLARVFSKTFATRVATDSVDSREKEEDIGYT